eukprot:Rmarinus@m.10605
MRGGDQYEPKDLHDTLVASLRADVRSILPITLPDGSTQVWCGERNGTLVTRNLHGIDHSVIKGHKPKDFVTCLARVDVSAIWAGLATGDITVYSIADHCFLRRIEKAHVGGVNTIQRLEDRVLSGGVDWQVKIWSADGQILQCFGGHTHSVKVAVWIPETVTVWSGGNDGRILVWRPQSSFPSTEMPSPPEPPSDDGLHSSRGSPIPSRTNSRGRTLSRKGPASNGKPEVHPDVPSSSVCLEEFQPQAGAVNGMTVCRPWLLRRADSRSVPLTPRTPSSDIPYSQQKNGIGEGSGNLDKSECDRLAEEISVWVGMEDGRVFAWRAREMRPLVAKSAGLADRGEACPVTAICAIGSLVWCCWTNGVVRLYAALTANCLKTLYPRIESPVRCLALVGWRTWMCCSNGTTKVWASSTFTAEEIRELQKHTLHLESSIAMLNEKRRCLEDELRGLQGSLAAEKEAHESTNKDLENRKLLLEKCEYELSELSGRLENVEELKLEAVGHSKKLEEELENVRTELNETLAERHDLRQMLKDSGQDADTSKKYLAESQDALDSARAKVAEMQEKLKVADETIAEKTTEAASLSETLSKIQSDLDETTKEKLTFEAQLLEEKNKSGDLSREIDEIRRNKEEFVEAQERKVSNILRQLSELEEERKNLRSLVECLRGEILDLCSNMEGKLCQAFSSELQNQSANADERLSKEMSTARSTWQTEKDGFAKRLEEQEKKVKDMEDMLSRERATKEAAEKERQQLSRDLKLERNKSSLSTKSANQASREQEKKFQQMESKLNQKLSAAEQALQKEKARAATAEETSKSLESQLAERLRLFEEKEALCSELEERLRTQSSEHEKRTQALETACDVVQRERDSTREDLLDKEKTLQSLQNELHAARERIRALESRLSEEHMKSQAGESEADELRKVKCDLEGKVADLARELQRTEGEREKLVGEAQQKAIEAGREKNDLTGRVEDLSSALKKVEGERESAREEAAKLGAERDEVREALREAKSAIVELGRESKERDEEIAAVKTKYEKALKARAESDSRQNENLRQVKEKLSEKTEETAALKRKLDAQVNELDEKSAYIRDLESRISQKEEILRQKEEEFEAARKVSDSRRETMERSHREQLGELTGALQKEKEENSRLQKVASEALQNANKDAELQETVLRRLQEAEIGLSDMRHAAEEVKRKLLSSESQREGLQSSLSAANLEIERLRHQLTLSSHDMEENNSDLLKKISNLEGRLAQARDDYDNVLRQLTSMKQEYHIVKRGSIADSEKAAVQAKALLEAAKRMDEETKKASVAQEAVRELQKEIKQEREVASKRKREIVSLEEELKSTRGSRDSALLMKQELERLRNALGRREREVEDLQVEVERLRALLQEIMERRGGKGSSKVASFM